MKTPEKNLIRWEPIAISPVLPKEWKRYGRRGYIRTCQTSFYRMGVKHPSQTIKEEFWVLFNEFDMNHHKNENLGFKYSVRGGNHVKPDENLRYFNRLRDAENYIIFLMESTDRWIAEITSDESIEAYERRIEFMKSRKK
jgi:hypothetical protein